MSGFQKFLLIFFIVIIGGGCLILSYVGIPSPKTEIRKIIPTPPPQN